MARLGEEGGKQPLENSRREVPEWRYVSGKHDFNFPTAASSLFEAFLLLKFSWWAD